MRSEPIEHMRYLFSLSLSLSLRSLSLGSDLKPLHCIEAVRCCVVFGFQVDFIVVIPVAVCYCCRCYDYYYFCYDYLSSICGNNRVRPVYRHPCIPSVHFFFVRTSFAMYSNPILPRLFDSALSLIFMLAFGIGPTNLYLLCHCKSIAMAKGRLFCT